MNPKITLSNLLVGGGGLLTFLFSFLDFFSSGPAGFNAWDTDVFAFASTVPAILGLVAAVWVGLEIGGVKLPEDVLTFNGQQLKAIWGIAAAGILLSWVTVGTSGMDAGIGLWLGLLSAAAAATGGVLGLLGIGTDPLTGSTPRAESDSDTSPPPPPPPPSA